MDKSALFHVLLLPLCLCFDNEETLVKTIGSEPDITSICSNATLSIALIVCKIRTERSRGQECRLLYKYGEDFVHECDSRFTLITKNQTVFLHLTSLTPADSGYYTCECSDSEGTYTLHLNITVADVKLEYEGARRLTLLSLLGVCIGGTIVIIITGVFLGFICRIVPHGNSSRANTSGLSVTPGSLDDPDDPYTSLQYPADDLYQTISHSASNVVTTRFDNQEVEQRDPVYEII